tara:strand:- start:452 stop:649 length:198 start_codon:yes stop_codon:yes gene_type:complete
MNDYIVKIRVGFSKSTLFATKKFKVQADTEQDAEFQAITDMWQWLDDSIFSSMIKHIRVEDISFH